jgi:arylsulfatase A-like enzyme
MLQRAGYTTAIVGKWHLKSEPTGFDYWNVLPGQGRYHNPVFIEMGQRKEYRGYVTDIITDLSLEFLEQARRRNRPFCLLCHHKAPHRGWRPDEKHAHLFEDVEIPEPETFDDDYRSRASAAPHADMRIADMPDYKREQPAGLSPEAIKRWNYQRFIKDYLRTIASVDENVGRLLRYLDETGLAENTLLIYTTDNGFFLGDHGWFDKRFMYEESLRIPFLVRYPPEVKPGSVDDHIVLNVDFAPTFLDYAGVPIPKDMQGRSLRPLLRGESPPDWRTSMYYHYYEYPGPHRVRPHYGVRTRRYKLIHYYTTGEWELFDLEKDPHELHNVYEAPAYAEVVQRLKGELERLRRELKDTTGA